MLVNLIRVHFVSFALIFFLATNAYSFTFTLELVDQPTSILEGDDYFTDVLNDPLDFDKRGDILKESNYVDSTVSVTDGVWSATTQNSSAAIFPLYQGPHGSGAVIAGAASVGANGVSFPLDADKYTSFSSISSISDASQRSIKAIAWTKGYADPSFSAGEEKKKTWRDSYNTNTNPAVYNGSGENILDIIDLSTHAAWYGKVTGILYDQSPAAVAGTVEKYRMFRVFDPDSAPQHTISWAYSDLPVYAAAFPPKVTIYVDSDNSDFDGALISRVPVYNDSPTNSVTSGTGSFTFPTASLPPGDYFFYVRLSDNVDNDTVVATSRYSERLTINAKPRIVFSNPSYTSGEDFATSKLRNPWDFNDASDITNLSLADDNINKQIKNYIFQDGYFSGTAFIPDGEPQAQTEAQIWLNTSFPILTSKYKYLTYELELDPTGYDNDKLGQGWMVRVSWYNVGFTQDGSITNDIVTYEGLRPYSLDLSTVSLEHEELGLPNRGWNSIPQATFLRLDPSETSRDTIFKIHDVKLTANPEPDYDTNQFEIKFNLFDKEDDVSTIEFFIDSDKSDYDGTLLGLAQYATGKDKSYVFSTQDLGKGDYYIYARVTDSAGNTAYKYSDIPFTNGELVSGATRLPYYRLYNPNNGEHHYTKNYAEYTSLGKIGWKKENIAYYIYDSFVAIDSVSAKPWFRLYNPNSGLHHWTLSQGEYNHLGVVGWRQEGLVGYFFDEQVSGSVPLYRLYNPNNGVHHWTKDNNENTFLINAGWKSEGIAGYVFNSLK